MKFDTQYKRVNHPQAHLAVIKTEIAKIDIFKRKPLV